MMRFNRQHFFGTLGAALMVLLPAGCSRQPAAASAPAEESVVLATVGGQTVTEADFRRAWQRQSPAADTPEARQQVLDALIARAAQVDAARRAGLDRDPELRDEIDRLLIGGLRQKQLLPQLEAVRAGEEDLKAYYEQHQQTRYLLPAQVHVAVLWFETRGQSPLAERYRPRLEAARAQVLADPVAFPVAKGFGVLAVTNSEHRVSRYHGGDAGWLTADAAAGEGAGVWNSAVQLIARNLQTPGDLSEVVEVPEGLFLVRLIERRLGGAPDYASVRGRVESDLLREQRKKIEADFEHGILAAAPVRRHPEALAALADLKSGNPANRIPNLNLPEIPNKQ
ncbi:MAG: hypothetical protein RLY20_269 [Verrucomicrobiota bacterium]